MKFFLAAVAFLAFLTACGLSAVPTSPPPVPTRLSSGGQTYGVFPQGLGLRFAPSGKKIKYPAVQLNSPTDGSNYICFRLLVLTWEAPALEPGEKFLVETLSEDYPADWWVITEPVSTTTLTLTPEKGGGGCSALWWSLLGTYKWRVTIISGNIILSPPSVPFTILYY